MEENRIIPRRVVRKYIMAHTLGLIPLTLILLLLKYFIHFSFSLLIAVLLIWCLKDILLFPLMWKSYDIDKENQTDLLTGKTAVVLEALDPEGWVKVHGQRWRARLDTGRGTVAVGTEVIISGREGLILRVNPSVGENTVSHPLP